MSFLKSLGKIGSGALNLIGVKTGSYAKPNSSQFPTYGAGNMSSFATSLNMNYANPDPGFKSGNGTLKNPIEIEEVTIKPNSSGGSTGLNNWIDKAIKGVDAVSGLISATKGNEPTNTTSSNVADSVNDWLGKATKDSREFGLDNQTKTFLGVAGGCVLAYFIFKK